jgi:hypothetical protein
VTPDVWGNFPPIFYAWFPLTKQKKISYYFALLYKIFITFGISGLMPDLKSVCFHYVNLPHIPRYKKVLLLYSLSSAYVLKKYMNNKQSK